MSEEILLEEMAAISEAIARAGRAPWKTARVVSVDREAQTADLLLAHGDQWIPAPGIPLQGDFLPDVGGDVLVLLGETAPVVLPGSSPGSIASRGRFETAPGNTVLADGGFEHPGVELVPNGDFEIDIRGWHPVANCTLAQSGAQFYVGTHSLAATAIGAGAMSLESFADFPSGLANVEEFVRYRFIMLVRAGATPRTPSFQVTWRDASGAVIGTPLLRTSTGQDSASTWSTALFFENAPAGAVTASMFISWAGAVAGEVHYIDYASLVEAVPGFDSGTGVQLWAFDTTPESWVGSNASVSSYVGPSPPPIAGPQALLVQCTTATAYGAGSPIGTAGVPVSGLPGATSFRHAASGFCRILSGPDRDITVRIQFYNAAGTLLGSTSGLPVTVRSDQWYEVVLSDVPQPATTAFASVLFLTTSSGAIGEQILIDAVTLTTPSKTQMQTNLDPTYVRTGTASMATSLLANGTASVRTPPGFDRHLAIPVIPGDFWKAECWYKNGTGNIARRAVYLKAWWYSSSGVQIGTQLGAVPVTTPGTGFTIATERFLVPTGAAYMRISAEWNGVLGEFVYIDDFVVAIDSKIVGRLIPQGQIDGVDVKTIAGDVFMLALPANPTFSSSTAWSLGNPAQPVRCYVQVLGTVSVTAATYAFARVEISFDNGLSWSIGVTTLMYAGGPSWWSPFHAAHEVTGMPTDQILYRFSVSPTSGGVLDVRPSTVTAWTSPAPPAGKQ